jgi:hypothetical protein
VEETKLILIENKKFGPNDTVVLDGHHYVGCVFDGCEVAYSGGEFSHDGTTQGIPSDLVFYGAANRTVELLKWCGYKIISPSGEQPYTKLLQ